MFIWQRLFGVGDGNNVLSDQSHYASSQRVTGSAASNKPAEPQLRTSSGTSGKYARVPVSVEPAERLQSLCIAVPSPLPLNAVL